MDGKWFAWLFVAAVILSVTTSGSAQENLPSVVGTTGTQDVTSIYADIPQFGGPSSVGGQLAEDAVVVPEYRLQDLQDLFEPWYEFKERLNEDHGLQFNIDESIFYQRASGSPAEKEAAGGLVRFYGQWELCGRESGNPGMVVFKVENRHRMGTVLTPFDLGFAAGSILPTGTFFSEFDVGLTNLYWKQYFFDRQLAVAAGRIDVTDFIDVYAMINPLTHFINLAFSTNPTIAVPNQGLGAAVGGMLTGHVYAQAGFGDANGQAALPGWDSFFDDAEYFSYAEVGITTGQDRIYLDNIHVTMWHTDAREAAGAPSSHGVAFTAQKFIDDKWLPFFRFGYSDGDAALMQTTFSTGLGYQCANRDVWGVGLSWGQPTLSSAGVQFTSEAFYRFQLTQFLAITPDVQLIKDPALNPGQNILAMFGLRLRAAF